MKKLNDICVVLLLIILIAAWSVIGYRLTRPDYIVPENPDLEQWHTVQSGECLWTIACKYYPGEHIGERVHEIRELNNMTSADVWPNDSLRLPKGAKM